MLSTCMCCSNTLYDLMWPYVERYPPPFTSSLEVEQQLISLPMFRDCTLLMCVVKHDILISCLELTNGPGCLGFLIPLIVHYVVSLCYVLQQREDNIWEVQRAITELRRRVSEGVNLLTSIPQYYKSIFYCLCTRMREGTACDQNWRWV